ncbi:glycerol-3-phosphate acyltransferase 3-like isoform X1 [Artemia franciscana]|nr:hypothetical protein QYM36_016343 [Artemia franciscana]
MVSLDTVLLTVAGIVLIPFVLVISFLVLITSFGWTTGFRRRYIEFLLWLFEYGRQKIEKAEKDKLSRTNSKESDMDEDIQPSDAKENSGNGTSPLIDRDELVLAPDPNHNMRNGRKKSEVVFDFHRARSVETFKRDYQLGDILDYVKSGTEAIIEDEVTQRFVAAELRSWNLLTRTNHSYEFINIRLTVIWVIGFFFRYFILLPSRVVICFIGVLLLCIATTYIGLLAEGPLKRSIYHKINLIIFRFMSTALSCVITYHNEENRPKKKGLCVANHTSPIDVLVLTCDNSYALIGQRHGGFLGIIQRALARASSHIWFERAEAKDRVAVAKRLKEHVEDPDKLPILIFPEGTCINNTSVMQFKKGSFEVGGTIYPVAIKYDARFGDAFWNSSRYSMMQHLYLMMTSWAIVCDVWYLPPMTRNEGESAIDFASRVKAAIARQGGLVDLMWDGQLKRCKPKLEWKQKQQEEFSKRLKVN